MEVKWQGISVGRGQMFPLPEVISYSMISKCSSLREDFYIFLVDILKSGAVHPHEYWSIYDGHRGNSFSLVKGNTVFWNDGNFHRYIPNQRTVRHPSVQCESTWDTWMGLLFSIIICLKYNHCWLSASVCLQYRNRSQSSDGC